MKKIPPFLLGLFIGVCVMAQSIERTLLPAAGDHYENEHIGVLDWTLGDLMVRYCQSGDYIIEQGFLHPDTILPGSLTIDMADFPIRLYPNPASQWLSIEAIDASILHAALYDMQGKNIKKYEFSTHIQIDLRSLPQGVYLLNISDGKTKSQSYRIVKAGH